MMKESLFEKIKHLEEELDHYLYIETVEYDWCTYDNNVQWVNVEGEVYSGEYNTGSLSRDDSVIINIDNGCGETVSMVFLKSKALSEEDFYDKYEEFM